MGPGTGMATSLSSLPGRLKAGSNTLGLLVAATMDNLPSIPTGQGRYHIGIHRVLKRKHHIVHSTSVCHRLMWTLQDSKLCLPKALAGANNLSWTEQQHSRKCLRYCSFSVVSCMFPWSVDSEVRSKRLRWFGYIRRLLDSRLPKPLTHG